MSSKRLFLPVVAALLTAAALPAPAAPTEGVLVRVHVARSATDADVLRIRDNIVSYGGDIRGYAAGDVLVARVPAHAVAIIEGLHRVDRVAPLPMPAPTLFAAQAALTPEQRTALMPKSCLSIASTPAQQQRAAGPLKLAPKVASNALAKRRALLAGQAALPSVVDNSLSHHFPPIGDQQWTPTCGAWAAGYYWSTYTQAVDEGLDVSGVWLPRDPPCDIFTAEGKFDSVKFAACLPTVKDPPRPSRATEHIGSPTFMYPLVRAYTWVKPSDTEPWTVKEDGGMPNLSYAMHALARWGIGSWQMRPFDPWLSEDYVFTWPTEAQWIEALPRRTGEPVQLRPDVAADFEALKQHLANGNLAAIDFRQTNAILVWGFDRACEGRTLRRPCPGINNDVLYANPGTVDGAHAVTVVGYDDDKVYFDAGANQRRRGAFLIANSAGPDFGIPNTAGGPTKGYFWMAYDFVRSSNIRFVMYNLDRPRYRPRLYAAAALAGAKRQHGELVGQIGFQGLDFPHLASFLKFDTGNMQPNPDEYAARPFEAGKRLVIDMTDGLPQIDLAGPVPLLAVASILSSDRTLGSVDFYFDRLGNGVFSKLPSPDPTRSAGVGSAGVVACNNVPQNGDVTLNGVVDRSDLAVITSTLRWPAQCISDPRDMDRDGRTTILDARKAALRCSHPACAPK